MRSIIRLRCHPTTAATVAAILLGSCDAPTRPEAEGLFAPRFELSRSDSQPRVIQALTGMQATVLHAETGAAAGTMVFEQKSPPDGPWTSRALKLRPGAYSVYVQGLVGTQLQHYGVSENQLIQIGKATSPTIVLAPVVPTLNPPPLANTTAFAQTISYSTIPRATDYEVQLANDAAFTSPTRFLVSAAGFDLTVNDIGTWYVRARPNLPAPAGVVMWSDSRQFTVFASPGGAAAGDAIATYVTPTAPDTVFERNLTSGVREGWFDIPSVRTGDTIVIETRAARLIPVSPLNTTLSLLQSDGIAVIASNDDATGSMSDSRIVTVAPVTGSLKARVGAVGNSVGHYELLLMIRRLPAAPSGLTATATSATSVGLSWVDNADNETTYRLERCASAGCTDFVEVGSVTVDVSSFPDAGLTTGATYRYRALARNAVGNSGYSSVVTVRLLAPFAPDSLITATQSGTTIALRWLDRSDDEDSFEVQRCEMAGCIDFTQRAVLPPNTVAFVDTGLAVDASYRYRVRARNAVATSSFSSVGAANTLRPAAPTSLTATTMSASRVDLTWSDNSDNEGSFVIERCRGVGCTDFQPLDTVPAATEAYSDASVTLGETYRYRISAVNVSGSSEYAPATAANTLPPAAPGNLTAVRVSAQVASLSWVDQSDSETGFQLQRCVGTACTNFAPLDSIGADSVVYVDAALPPDSAATYRVRAVNVVGQSAFISSQEAAAVPSSVSIDPASLDFTSTGAVRNLTPTARFAGGGMFGGLAVTSYSWISRNPGIAIVNATGSVTSVSLGTTRVIAVAPGGAADSVTVVVRIPAWWDAVLDFAGGSLPIGWRTRLIGDYAGLRNDRLESIAVDNGPVVIADGRAPAGILGLVVEFDGQAIQSASGNGHHIELWSGATRNTVGAVNATNSFGLGNVQVFAARSGSGGIVQDTVVSFAAGDHRHRVVIRQDSVVWSSRLSASNMRDFTATLPSPGWDLSTLDSVGVRAQAADVDSWMDNVRIRAITDLSTAATLDLSPPVSAVAVGQRVLLSGQARSISGSLLSGRTVVWSSESPGIANVSATGVVTGVAAGTAKIVGMVDGAIATAVITVLGSSDLIFADDFSSDLSNWVERDLDGLGAWSLSDSSLYGDYDIGCGSPNCNQLQLLLAEMHQPGNADWRIEVDAKRDTQFTGYNGGLIGSRAAVVLWVSDAEKEQIYVGNSWQGLVAPTESDSVYAVVQSYPWSGGTTVNERVAPWTTARPQTVAIERRGSEYRVYWNGELVLTTVRNLSASPRVGLHSYGAIRMDRFRLYRLP